MTTLNKYARRCWQIAEDHGFHEDNRPFSEIVALIHSEVSEALEADRNGEPLIWHREDGKAEGAASEIIDVIIRCFDWLGDPELEIDIDNLIYDKMEYNAKRPYKHGKEY